MLLNKIDLLPPVDFERSLTSAREVKPATEALQVSAKTGEGIDAWYDAVRFSFNGKKGRCENESDQDSQTGWAGSDAV